MKKFRRKVLDMLMSNNSGSSLRQQLLDGAPFCSELLYTAIPQRAASGTTATFTRATTSTWKNNDGYMVTGVAGEIGFVGARRVRNLLTLTEDFSTAVWSKSNASMSANQIAAPNGTTTADLFTATANAQQTVWFAAGITGVYSTVYSAYVKAGTATWLNFTLWDGAGVLGGGIQVWFNLFTGAVGSSVVGAGFSLTGTSTESVGNGWYRIAIAGTATGGAFVPAFRITDSNGVNATTATNGKTFYIWGAQVEDVTAQTTQTEGEYVSVGALDYRSELNRLYLSLPGTAGHYASTPDSVANSITGDIDIRVKVAMTDWTPAADSFFVAKDETAARRSFGFFYRNGTGKIAFYWTADGATPITSDATAALPVASFIDGTTHWVRVTFDANNGAAGTTATFYWSDDGSTWTQLGDPVVTAGVATIFDSVSPLEIGSLRLGTTGLLNGKVHAVQIYNTVGGTTPVVDFNPHRDAVTPTGTITSSTTGEVWTINGASSVVRSDYYHGSFVDGIKCFPTDLSGNPLTGMLGYQAQGARTNLCLQSNAFTTTWVNDGLIPVQNSIGPDGGTTAWTLDDNAAGAVERIYQTGITLTAATYTMSVFIKKTSTVPGANSYPLIYATQGANIALATIDPVNGTATVWTTYVGPATVTSSARCTSYNSTYWRVELTFLATAAAWSVAILPAAAAQGQSTGVESAAGVGSQVFYGAQLELGSFANSYIATTTLAVARNGDVLTYTGGDIPNLKTLMAGFRRESGVSSAGWAVALSDGTISNYESISAASDTEARFLGVAGGVVQWDVIPSYTAGTTSKAAFSAATNDIKMAKDGSAQTQDTSATVPTVTQLDVGHVAGSFQLNGNVGPIYGWTRNLSQSEENAVTV